jgi:hypothetical protein
LDEGWRGEKDFRGHFFATPPFAEQEAGYKNTPQMAKRFSSEAEYRSSPTALCTTCMNPTVEGIVEVEMTFTSFVTTANPGSCKLRFNDQARYPS